MIEKLIEQLKRHEGTGPVINGNLMPYEDSEGLLTIGYGICIARTGITPHEAEFLLRSRVEAVDAAARRFFPWVSQLDPVRQAVVMNMAYNLGIDGFRKFKKTISYIQLGEYRDAAAEMLNSKWAVQVGNRAIELAEMMQSGEWPE